MVDGPVQRYIESELGFPLDSFPDEGVDVRVSPVRADRDGDRMLNMRLGPRALVTGTPSVVEAIEPTIRRLDIWELFSPFGQAELTRAMEPQGVKVKGGGFHYTLRKDDFICPELAMEPAKLIDMTMPDASSFDKDWFDAFGITQDGQQVALAKVRWKSRELIEIAVTTHEEYRSRGYGRAVVAGASEWILAQDAMVHYPVWPSNISSIRIPNRLGFRLAWHEFYA